jgi:hypothetical protein
MYPTKPLRTQRYFLNNYYGLVALVPSWEI